MFLTHFKGQKEIRHYQRTAQLLISRRAFGRVVREISTDMAEGSKLEGLRWQAVAIEALQMGAELFTSDLFCMAQYAAIHARRATLMVRDMNLVYNIQAHGSNETLRKYGVSKSFEQQ